MYTIISRNISASSVQEEENKQKSLATEVNEFIKNHPYATVEWLQSESPIPINSCNITLTAIIRHNE